MNLVEAVKDKSVINEIERLFKKHFKNTAYANFWKLNVNLALRVSDLLLVKFNDIELNRDRLVLKETKTSKRREIKLNGSAISVINERRLKYPGDIYLFQSQGRRTQNLKPRPMSRSSINKAFREIADIVNLTINSHSCRKTRGYMLRMSGVPIEKITKMLNHSSTAVTMRYIGLDQEEVNETYDLEL